MANCLLLLNTGDQVLLNTGDKVLLNDNTCSDSTAHGIWEGPLAPPETVKLWPPKKKIKEESKLELLIILQPIMGQLFKTDLTGLPYLKTYKDKLYDFFFNPIKHTFNEFKILNGGYIKGRFLNAELHTKYTTPIISFRPFKEQIFRKTLYGEKLHGLHIIEMVKKLIGSQNLSFSFEFNDKELAYAVTNKPPIGEPTEEERELEFDQPSSFVGNVIYSPDIQTMEIELNGQVYNYCGVPMRIYEQFESAGSKGEYYNREIRGIYTC